MSAGRPYFDRMAVPIGAALLFLMGVGPALPWGAATGAQMRRALLPPLAGAAVAAAIGFALGVRNGWTLATIAFGGYTAQVTLRELWLPLGQRLRQKGEGLLAAAVETQRHAGRRVGAYVVHAGVVLIMIAIAVSSTMGIDKEVLLRQGEVAELGPYQLRFAGAREVEEAHRVSLVARVEVSREGRPLGVLEPRMNHYHTQREPIGTPAVRTGFGHDLYLSILNVDPAAQTLGVHILLNPMVGWIWIATGIMALGGVLALLPALRRERAAARAPAAAAVGQVS
jgi:cytochrome c-type biogenesis protein CcmF